MNSNTVTTLIGFASSFVIVANHQGLIEPNLGTLIAAVLAATFGYFTNKPSSRA